MSFFWKHFWGRSTKLLHWYFCQQLSCHKAGPPFFRLSWSLIPKLLFLGEFRPFRILVWALQCLKSFQMQCLCTCCVSVKKPKQKTCLKPFYFYPGAKFNLFMQLAVVLETELELYLHINILIAGRILGLNPVRADRVCVQNNARIIVSLLCCLF